MKRWAWIVAGLYGLVLASLMAPVVMVAFHPNMNLADAGKGYLAWPFWLWIAVMVVCQAALLAVPVNLADRRPVTRRSLWLPVATAGLMMGGLAVGAIYSVYEFVVRDGGDDWILWAAPGAGVLLWLLWAVIFFRAARALNPGEVVARQCRWMLRGSILELLVAVPTHIVARYRDYCCAGFMTCIGITLGISVMLFSFGPAVFFLYADRWRRLHPASRRDPASPGP